MIDEYSFDALCPPVPTFADHWGMLVWNTWYMQRDLYEPLRAIIAEAFKSE